MPVLVVFYLWGIARTARSMVLFVSVKSDPGYNHRLVHGKLSQDIMSISYFTRPISR